MLRIIAWMLLFLLFCLVISFAAANNHAVVLEYYLGRTELSLAVLLLMSLCVGVVLGIIFNLMWVWTLYTRHQQLKKLHKQALREIEVLLGRSRQDAS